MLRLDMLPAGFETMDHGGTEARSVAIQAVVYTVVRFFRCVMHQSLPMLLAKSVGQLVEFPCARDPEIPDVELADSWGDQVFGGLRMRPEPRPARCEAAANLRLLPGAFGLATAVSSVRIEQQLAHMLPQHAERPQGRWPRTSMR
jgi:hypothetical protein